VPGAAVNEYTDVDAAELGVGEPVRLDEDGNRITTASAARLQLASLC
jgi:hypothetical protein